MARTALEVAALRKLDLMGPEQLVSWATERAAEHDAPSQILAIATLSSNVRAEDVDPLVDDLLDADGVRPLDEERAGLIVAMLLAQDMIDGTIEPAVGARTIWWDVVERAPATRNQLLVFIGLASEWEDNPQHRQAYEQEILGAAQDLLDHKKHI